MKHSNNQKNQIKFAYIQNLRLPHEMAHSIAVVKATEAATALGYNTYLLHPRRTQTSPLKGKTLRSYYDLQHDISDVTFSVPELWNWPKPFQLIYHRLRSMTMAWVFAVQAFFYAKNHDIQIVQTGDREILVLIRLLSFLYHPKIIYDVHNDFADWYNLPLLKFSKNIISLTVANCDYIKDFLIKQGVSETKIIVLPNGFEPRYYNFTKSVPAARKFLKLPVNRFIFGYVGRFETLGYEKGIDTMLQAAAIIKNKLPITIVAVGGPFNLAEKYRRLTKKLGLTKNEAIIVDQVNPKLVADYIYTFDVASLLYPDTFHFRHKMSPMKAIEYLAAGKPIIASDFPTLRPLLKKYATYIQPQDPQVLAQTLIKHYKQHSQLNRHTNKIQKFASKFTWKNRQKEIFSSLGKNTCD